MSTCVVYPAASQEKTETFNLSVLHMQILTWLLILKNYLPILIPFKHLNKAFIFKILGINISDIFFPVILTLRENWSELIIRKLENFRYSELNLLCKQGRW